MPTTPYVADPPRAVPLTTTLAVLFGGFMPQFGLLWLLFSLPFVLVFLPLNQLSQLATPTETRTASGTITAVEYTNSSTNGQTVLQYHFTFIAEDGAPYEGSSYTTDVNYEVGETVSILYPAGQPSRAYIQGQRLDVFPAWVGLFVGIFPLIGFIFLGVHLAKVPLRLRILRWGRFATGTLTDTSPTNVRINNQTVMKLTYQVTLPSGKTFEAVARSHQPSHLKDEAQEPLLYLEDGTGSTKAQLLDELPGRPRFDQNGNLQPTPFINAFVVCILPGLVLAALVVAGYFLLG